MATLGERIKQLRTENEMTQEEFGKLFGVTKYAVSLYESDKSVPNDEIKKKIADYFQVSLDWLMGVSEIRNPADKITEAVSGDPELAEFWEKLRQRDDLKLLLKQIRHLPPEAIMRIIRVIKAIEDEEAAMADI